jgi:hypothetical protein
MTESSPSMRWAVPALAVAVAWGGSPHRASAIDCAHPTAGISIPVPGDLNGNALVSVVDAQCAVLVTIWEIDGGSSELPGCVAGEPLRADTNCDSTINITDVLLVVILALGDALGPTVDADQDGCPDLCGGPQPSLACCASQASPGCGSAAVESCVCAEDPFCCDSQWDLYCALAAPACGAACDAVCGDGACTLGETCAGCAVDCGACPGCGDGACGPGETCLGCAADCGACPGACPDGVCDPWEGCLACPDDCGACAGDCCEAGGLGCDDAEVSACVCGEDPYCCGVAWDALCAVAAGAACGAECAGACGDGVCGGGEGCIGCPEDCGACGICGDGLCDVDVESCLACPTDCGACAGCGDGACDPSEQCASCPDDCGPCGGDCCAEHGGTGCADWPVASCTCALDEWCCAVGWDALCVALAAGSCASGCPDVCGDGVCDAGEGCEGCPADCGTCPEPCGDGVCDSEETCSGCPGDCGACPGSCCAAHEGTGCSQAPVQACVCGLDAWCCAGAWDSLCAAQALVLCGATCDP